MGWMEVMMIVVTFCGTAYLPLGTKPADWRNDCRSTRLECMRRVIKQASPGADATDLMDHCLKDPTANALPNGFTPIQAVTPGAPAPKPAPSPSPLVK